MMEKLLPHNIDAELAVLGSILTIPRMLDEVSDLLVADDFYRDAHKTIYAAMLRLHLRHEGIDFVTLSDELEREGKLEDAGNTSYLVKLSTDAPLPFHAIEYARIVAAKAEHRERIRVAGQIASLSYEEKPEAQVRSEQLLGAVGERGHGADFASLSDVLLECANDFDAMKEDGSILGVPTGFHGLDKLTGGFQASDLIFLAGRPGTGKTTWAQNMAYNAMLNYGIHIAFCSLEMSKKQLGHRFISMDSEINSQRLRLGHIDDERNEWDKVSKSMGVLSEGRLWIDDTAGLDVDVMRSRLRRLHTHHRVDLLIVDYLQQMHATIEGKRPQMAEQEVSEIARKLKQVAKELNIPVLALAQLNRAVEGRAEHVPQLSDLRGSGQLEQEADIVMFLYRNTDFAGTVDMLVEKHRNGPTGLVRLGFEGKYNRFYNIDQYGRRIA